MELKLFNRWDSAVNVSDPSLKQFINLEPRIVPQTFGRNQQKKFWKSKMHIVERLVNKVAVAGHRGKKHMRTSGRNVGKVHKITNIVREVFERIEKKTKSNPVQILVQAIENSAPREEVTVVEYGGIRHPRAVDVAPQRRVDLALRWITQGAFQAAAKGKAGIVSTLTKELILASEKDTKSYAVSKRYEVERQAMSSR